MSSTQDPKAARVAAPSLARGLGALAVLALLGATGCDAVFGIRDGVLRPAQGGTGGAGGSAGVGGMGGGPPVERDADEIIAADTTWTRDAVWRLRGASMVKEGASLTIESGTTIVADPGGVLVVEPGAKVRAMGERDAPIVFTSSARFRRSGDWGGLFLCGRARLNTQDGRAIQIELPPQISPRCGGEDDDDSSGELHYVRIEFAGQAVVPGENLAGLQLVAVGRGTAVDHVQVLRAADDAFYARGGAVRLKQILAVGGSDDGLDWENGWRGDAQFVAVLKDEDAPYSSGIEGDSQDDGAPDALPISNPRVFNATLVGRAVDGNDTDGIDLGSGTKATISNALVVDFVTSGLDLSESATYERAVDGSLDVTHSVFANPQNFSDDVDFAIADWATLPQKRNLALAPGAIQLVSVSTDAPDFSVRAGSPALTQGVAPPNDGFFDPTATFAGVCGTSCDELKGWTAFPRE